MRLINSLLSYKLQRNVNYITITSIALAHACYGTSLCKEALHRDPVTCLLLSPDLATNTHASGHTEERFSLVTANLYSAKQPGLEFSQKGEC